MDFDLGRLMYFGKCEVLLLGIIHASGNLCNKKEKGLGKISSVTGSNSLLKFKHFCVESQVKSDLYYQLLILLTLRVDLDI